MTINRANVSIPGCGLVANGDLTVNASTVTAGSLGYVDSDDVNGSTFNGASPEKALPAADPCATVPGCAYLQANPPAAGGCLPATFTGLSHASVPAGTYCSTLTINGCASVTFGAGLYVLEQGMTINGSSNISGSGVTFYNESGGIVGLNGSAGSLSAPSTGNDAGVLVYQVPSDSSPIVYNGSTGSLSGALYAPGAAITLNGGFANWLLVVEQHGDDQRIRRQRSQQRLPWNRTLRLS